MFVQYTPSKITYVTSQKAFGEVQNGGYSSSACDMSIAQYTEQPKLIESLCNPLLSVHMWSCTVNCSVASIQIKWHGNTRSMCNNPCNLLPLKHIRFCNQFRALLFPPFDVHFKFTPLRCSTPFALFWAALVSRFSPLNCKAQTIAIT